MAVSSKLFSHRRHSERSGPLLGISIRPGFGDEWAGHAVEESLFGVAISPQQWPLIGEHHSGKLAEQSRKSVATQLRGVKSRRRQAPERLGDLLRRDAAGFRGRFSGQEIGKHGTGCDRRNAALCLKTRRGDSVALHAHGQPQSVTADGVCHFDRGGSVRKIARVVWVPEVLEDSFVGH